jgi:hypothetical protein
MTVVGRVDGRESGAPGFPDRGCGPPPVALARTGNSEADPGSAGIRFTIGIMVDSAEDVDQLTGQMRTAGAHVTKEPVDAEFYSGPSAYLSDPESNYFEITWAAPANPITSRRAHLATPRVRPNPSEDSVTRSDVLAEVGGVRSGVFGGQR